MENQQANAKKFVWANGLQGIGDQIVAAKTVLPWLFTAAGVPAALTGLLVPIRESGSMLPQAALSPWVTSQRARKRVWLLGSWGQAIAAGLIAVAAAFMEGLALGVTVIVLLAVLSVFRALCSIAGKDVQGRTVEKGHRGLITGRATALSGAFTLVIGLVLVFLPNELPRWIIVVLLGGGALSWALASLVFTGIAEPEAEAVPRTRENWVRTTWDLVSEDKELRRFLLVRSLLLVTSLSTSFIVVLANEQGADFSNLGGFIIASGAAALLGGRIFGSLSDRSSRATMAWGATAASVVIVGLVVSANVASSSVNAWIMPTGFFLVTLAHTAVRVSRKTYLVDMAEGDRRTLLTGVSNTVIGIVLLAVGALSSAMAVFGAQAALLFLVVIGAGGIVGAWNLKDVSEPEPEDH